MNLLVLLIAVVSPIPLMTRAAVRTEVPIVMGTNPAAERMMHGGSKVFIKSAALSSRQRSDLYEVYIPYRYVDQDIRAISTINGSNNISGVIYFTQTTPPAGSVTIRGVIRGLKPGKHSIHINQMGDLRNSCLSTGGHYNPYNFTHGPPFVRQRHVGDLGNIQVNQDGSADFTLVDKMLTLVGSRSIIGRSVVIDEGEDDLGKIRTSESTKTGNSGSPVACGVIGRLE